MFSSPLGGFNPYQQKENRNVRMPLNTFKAMFLGMPGIREYRLEDRIQFNLTGDIPTASSLVSSYDRDRKCISVKYSHMEDTGDIFRSYVENREILFVPVSGSDDREFNENLSKTERTIKRAVDWMKKEMYCYPADAQVRKTLDEEENKAREEVRLEFNRERLDKEDEDMFVAMNNPFSIREFMDAIQAELDDENNKFKHIDYLKTYALKEGINEDDRIGVGEFIIDRAGDIIIMQMRRNYEGHTAAGRFFRKFDGRKVFTIDATALLQEDPYKHGFEREALRSEFKRLIELAMKRLGEKQ